MAELHIPDVSEFQPDVNWSLVAEHNGGAAIIRALYGAEHVDRAWYGGARRTGAHTSGIRVLGIYQYLVADQDPADQAKAFVRLVRHLEPGEFAALDIEEGAGDQLARAKEWLRVVDGGLTYPGYSHAWVYSGADFFEEHGLMSIADSTRHTWVADYGSAAPSVPHTLWQHTDAEDWPGIGPCDCSIYVGDLARLEGVVTGKASAG